MKKLLLLFIFLLTSCSTVIIYSPKNICIKGSHNEPVIAGAELEGNKMSQESTSKADIED